MKNSKLKDDILDTWHLKIWSQSRKGLSYVSFSCEDKYSRHHASDWSAIRLFFIVELGIEPQLCTKARNVCGIGGKFPELIDARVVTCHSKA